MEPRHKPQAVLFPLVRSKRGASAERCIDALEPEAHWGVHKRDTFQNVGGGQDATQRFAAKCKKRSDFWQQGRLVMEVQQLFAYGSAAETVRLLWRHELLDMLFPVLADYLERQKFPRRVLQSLRCQDRLCGEA